MCYMSNVNMLKLSLVSGCNIYNDDVIPFLSRAKNLN